MKKTSFAIVLTGLALGLVPGSILAQDKKEEELKVNGSVAVGVQAVSEVERSSKFFEYRDVPRGAYVPFLSLDLTKGAKYFYLEAMRPAQRDQRVLAGFGKHGTFSLDLGYAETPHRFSFAGATPYVEASPGVFTLNDVIRAAAEALVPTGTSTNIAAARALVSSFLASAGPIDLGLLRKKATLDFSYTPSIPFTFNVAGSYETRTGNRPYGASLGFSNAIEVPEPIHYKTANVDTSLEYDRKWGMLRAGIFASLFDNDVQTLYWDNPYRITDSTYGSAYSAGNGTAHGQMALWPSNDAVKFYLSGTFKPVKGTRISAAASFGTFNQNQSLLPFTVNTAIPASDPAAANALSAPRETAMAKADITSLDLTLHSRIVKSVTLTAGFRYYDFANKTEELDMPDGYARLDQVWEAIPIAIEPYSYSRSRLFGDVNVNVLKNTSFVVGYSVYDVHRQLGHAEAEKDKTSEGTFKIAFDSVPLDWLNLRVSYINADRDWSLNDSWYAYIPSFNFKRYFEADRKRQAVNALVGLTPVDRFDIQLSYSLGRDDYPHSDYGLTRDDFDMYGVDISYAFAKNQVLYGFYNHEAYDADQAARQSGATFSTNPADDWTANIKDTIDTFGVGQMFEIVPDKLRFNLSGSFSKAVGSSFLDSPPGGTPNTAVNFGAPLDATTWWTTQANFKWRMSKSLSVVLSYWYEQYNLSDIVRNDAAVDYASAGAIFLGALEPGYKYHVGSLKFVYTW
ncbi:MAG TPA: MtrB/PioB family decaheme-associated outer membrane protein [Acidobacteriota bacterium]|nr:MtrB/PioB family decaheme-associated outer membrane protein [Acidobacteriota bacterium]